MYVHARVLKALSHDIRDIFRTLRAGRFYHAPLIEKLMHRWHKAVRYM